MRRDEPIVYSSFKFNYIRGADKVKDRIAKAKAHSLHIFISGALVFLISGVFAVATAPRSLTDYRVMYYSAHSLLSGHDPYDQIHTAQAYQNEKKTLSPSDSDMLYMLRYYVYPPTTFVFTAPFALLPWSASITLWLMLFALGAILASWLIWRITAPLSPILGSILIAYLLLNSQVLWMTGTISGIAVALCVIAAWCFLQERCIPAGVLCMALSLLVKPQDSGLIWLYFLLAGGVYRKRALQSLLAAACIGLPVLLWVSRIAPFWVSELHASLQAFFVPGGLNSPGLSSRGGHGVAEIISLQAIFSIFRDEPRFYNLVSYLLCAPLLLAACIAILRKRATPQNAWLALAALSAFTMLPVYHRLYDAKLFLLAIPACAILWARRGVAGKIAAAASGLCCLLISDISRVALLQLAASYARLGGPFSFVVIVGVTVFSVPLILLLLGVFYLWLFIAEKPAHAVAVNAAQP
jgi:hypothetical protein